MTAPESALCFLPVSKNGTSITIRKFYDNPLTMEDLINGGTISEEAADYLINAVKQKEKHFHEWWNRLGEDDAAGNTWQLYR